MDRQIEIPMEALGMVAPIPKAVRDQMRPGEWVSGAYEVHPGKWTFFVRSEQPAQGVDNLAGIRDTASIPTALADRTGNQTG